MADSADGMVEELDYEHENDGGEVGGEEVEGGEPIWKNATNTREQGAGKKLTETFSQSS